MTMTAPITASERLHARSAINTTQADWRCVVPAANAPSCRHLGEMRPTISGKVLEAVSHIFDMQEYRTGHGTTLRCADVELSAPNGACYASAMSDMAIGESASERLHARSAINTTQADRRRVVPAANAPSCRHLGEMRPTTSGKVLEAVSHIFDMQEYRTGHGTTLRCADVELSAPNGACYASAMSDMAIGESASERLHARSAINTTQADRRRVVPAANAPSCRHLGEMRQSVLEKIFFPNSNTVPLKEFSILFSKRPAAVMLFLFGDISYYFIFVAQIVGEAGILFTPPFKTWEMGVRLKPLASRNLELLNKLGHRQVCWKRHKKMYMVRHASNAVKAATDIVYKTEYIRIKVPLMILFNGGNATMCTENNVIGCLGETHKPITECECKNCA